MDDSAIALLANRLYAAEVQARSQVDEAFRLALFRTDGASSAAWGLALVLACWRRQKAGQSLDELASTGVTALIGQIASFEGYFPGSFQKFLETAEGAADVGKIAAASSYFATTVKELGTIARPGLLSWIASPKFTTVAAALTLRFGGPATKPVVAPSATKTFERVDYRAPAALAAPKPSAAQEPAPARLVSVAPSTRDLQVATLVKAGWTAEQAALLLAGPNASTTKGTKTSGADKSVTSQQGDAGGIPGVIKSGLDLVRDIMKQVTGSTSGGSGANNGSKTAADRTKDEIRQSIGDPMDTDIAVIQDKDDVAPLPDVSTYDEIDLGLIDDSERLID